MPNRGGSVSRRACVVKGGSWKQNNGHWPARGSQRHCRWRRKHRFQPIWPGGAFREHRTFFSEPGSSVERESFLGKARAGMKSQIIRGHTVSRSSLSTSTVVALILCKWGCAGQDHTPIEEFPEGFVDTVIRWVSCCR